MGASELKIELSSGASSFISFEISSKIKLGRDMSIDWPWTKMFQLSCGPHCIKTTLCCSKFVAPNLFCSCFNLQCTAQFGQNALQLAPEAFSIGGTHWSTVHHAREDKSCSGCPPPSSPRFTSSLPSSPPPPSPSLLLLLSLPDAVMQRFNTDSRMTENRVHSHTCTDT